MSERRVVLHLIDSFGLGGAQQRYFNDLRYLGQPFEHRAYAVFGAATEAPQAAGLNQPLHSLELQRFRQLPAGVARLSAVLRADPSIELIHTQLFAADLIGRVAGAYCRRLVVSTVQSATYERDSGLYSRWRHWADRLTARMSHHLIAVSEFVRQSIHQHLRAPLDRITVIPNTVDLRMVAADHHRRAETRRALDLDDRHFAWLTVGRLHAAKGYAGLLGAFARLSATTSVPPVLLFAGDGPQKRELQTRAEALGIAGRVRFLGNRPDVIPLLDASDAFVFPSLSEGLPVSLLEAMAMQKGCVASRIAPHEELISDGLTGLLVAPRDDLALAEAMAAMQCNPTRRRAMAAAASERVVRHFGAAAGAARLTTLYRALTASGGDDAARAQAGPA